MPDIEVMIENSVAVVTLNRPAKRNTVTLAMWKDTARMFEDLGRGSSARATIIAGSGGNFSVGADISEFNKLRANVVQSSDYERAVDAASKAIADVPKPTIAVITGYCPGGGCHLAMACDFRFASSSAVFGIPAARLSIVYGLRSTQRLLALVGLTQAKRILFSGEYFDGFADAQDDDPMHMAKQFAVNLAENALLSIAGAKFILNGLTAGQGALDENKAQAIIDLASASEDYNEGRLAFVEKRKPVFHG